MIQDAYIRVCCVCPPGVDTRPLWKKKITGRHDRFPVLVALTGTSLYMENLTPPVVTIIKTEETLIGRGYSNLDSKT